MNRFAWLLAWMRRHRHRSIPFGLVIGAGVLAGVLLTLPAPHSLNSQAPPPEVWLAGEKLDVTTEGATERALEIVRRYAFASLTLTLPGGKKRPIPRASLGVEIDRAYLAALVGEAKQPQSALRREHATKPGGGPLKLPVPLFVDSASALHMLLVLKDELDTLPADARLDLSTRKVVPEVEGYRLDVYATLARIDDALQQGDKEVEALGETLAPNLAASRLGNLNFEDVLGYFETRYNNDKEHEARTYNLRLAASRLDGHVLLPGETFDFNARVGPRTEAMGYKVAPVIAEGELVDGIGGGTCQISGTLYGAAFFSGLDVVARTPHTRPSAYIKMGLDAAVAYPTINLRLKNPFSYPVVLHETVRDGIVRAEILGPKRKHTVTLVRKIDETVPFQEVERPDPKLRDGVKVLSQRGIPGFKLHRYRIVREGPFAVRERSNDTYPPTPQIVRVGTATDVPKDTPVPEDDTHPEYLADDYLTLTQGPDVRSAKTAESEAGGGMIETREPGRTGEAGWIKRAGMSHWEPKKAEVDVEQEPTTRTKNTPKKSKK